MTQQEYDARMSELSNQRRAEIAPLHNQLERLHKEKAFLKDQRMKIFDKEREVGGGQSMKSALKFVRSRLNMQHNSMRSFLTDPRKLNYKIFTTMTIFRIVLAAVFAAIEIAIVWCVSNQWHAVGCGWESIAIAIAFYTSCLVGFWYSIDSCIADANK